VNRLYFEGLDLAEWTPWLDGMVTEAEAIVTAHVTGAEADIKNAYPSTAPALAAAMTHHLDREAYHIDAEVVNPHPLAWIYDHGTMLRHTATGAPRGGEGPHHIFVPRAYDWARRQYLELSGLLERYDFVVTGLMHDGDVIA
jgi:hypothetical protein